MKPQCSINKQGTHVKAGSALSIMNSAGEWVHPNAPLSYNKATTSQLNIDKIWPPDLNKPHLHWILDNSIFPNCLNFLTRSYFWLVIFTLYTECVWWRAPLNSNHKQTGAPDTIWEFNWLLLLAGSTLKDFKRLDIKAMRRAPNIMSTVAYGSFLEASVWNKEQGPLTYYLPTEAITTAYYNPGSLKEELNIKKH